MVVVADEGRDGPSGGHAGDSSFRAGCGSFRCLRDQRFASRPARRLPLRRCAERWIMMAPERLMLPDEQAVEILHLVDGKTSGGGIVDAFATRYTEAVRELIARDVAAMLQDCADKGCLTGDSSD